MRGLKKCVPLLILAVWMLFAAVRAELAPEMQATMQAPVIKADVTARINALPGAAEETLRAINAGLEKLTITLFGGEREAGIAALYEGETIFSVFVQEDENGVSTAFFPSGRVYLTEKGQTNALSLLSGQPEETLWRFSLREYAAAAPGFFEQLDGLKPPRTQKNQTTIKNAGTSAAFSEYLLTEDHMNTLLPAIREAAERLLPGVCAAPSSLLFEGEGRFKRFLDAQGGDMGLQFTGRVLLDGESRKATLFGGYSKGKGGSFSLSLPAVKGKNSDKITYSEKTTEKKSSTLWEALLTCEHSQNGRKESDQAKLAFQSISASDGERLTGEAVFTKTAGKEKTVLSIKPDMIAVDGRIQGTLLAAQKNGPEAVLQFCLTAGEGMPSIAAGETVDLRGMTDAQASQRVLPEMQHLLKAFSRWLGTLDDASRHSMTHDLRTEDWMQPGSISLPDDWTLPETNDFLVKEENE